MLSATPFCTSAGVVADCASFTSRSCPETVGPGFVAGLRTSSVCLLDSGFACTSSLGATTWFLSATFTFSGELVASKLALGVECTCSEGRAVSTASLRTPTGESLFSLTGATSGTTLAGVGLTTSACTELG